MRGQPPQEALILEHLVPARPDALAICDAIAGAMVSVFGLLGGGSPRAVGEHCFSPIGLATALRRRRRFWPTTSPNHWQARGNLALCSILRGSPSLAGVTLRRRETGAFDPSPCGERCQPSLADLETPRWAAGMPTARTFPGAWVLNSMPGMHATQVAFLPTANGGLPQTAVTSFPDRGSQMQSTAAARMALQYWTHS